MSDRRSLRERLLRRKPAGAQAKGPAESRLQPGLAANPGCPTKQADLPIGRRFANPPHKVLQSQGPSRGFLESVNVARMSTRATSADFRQTLGVQSHHQVSAAPAAK